MSQIKVLELFSGIGSQTQALKNIGIEHISTQCDIDKYAVDAYNQLHGETENLGDISKIQPEDLHEGQWDLITFSSPCQDFSISGLQAGGEKGSGTRSSLLWECEKIIRAVKPKYLLFENVKNLVSKKFLPLFESWLKVLEDMGYTNYWEVLNAKDFGVPQNRQRVFCVSILGEHKPYIFPEPKPLTKRLRDVLESKVDEKYYLNDDKVKPLIKIITDKIRDNASSTDCENNKTLESDSESKIEVLGNYKPSGHECGRIMDINGISPTIKENHGAVCAIAEPQVNRICNIYGEDRGTGYAGNVWDKDGLCPTLDTMQGGNRQPMIVETVGYEVDLPNGKKAEIKEEITEATCFKEVRTEIGKQARREARQKGLGDTTPRNKDSKMFVPTQNGLSNCLLTGAGVDQLVAEPTVDCVIDELYKNREPRIYTESSPCLRSNCGGLEVYRPFRIRKLTPKECWRLMGWKDDEIDKVKNISNNQLYKQAGNSIVVNVLEEIFKKMFL
jgi:DNA (cytosine-5)-methyltransferase 1